MKPLRAPASWLALLILTCLPGCDNVEWGGADVAILPPPPKASGGEAAAAPGEERPPEGPILYHVSPRGNEGILIPVGEIAGDTLRPIQAASDWELFGRRFIAEHLRQGTEFALFRNGARVGTFIVQSAAVPDSAVCPRLPRAIGTLELITGAESAPEFLALAKPHAPAARRQASAPAEPNRTIRLLAPYLAEGLLRARGAQLPGNWQRAIVQLAPFPIAGAADPAFAATLLVDDTLGPGFDDVGYSLFFVARPQQRVGYDTIYASFTDYPSEGKAAPRVVDYLDWDRDDQAELLLQVYGTRDTWFEAVGNVGNTWRRIFRQRCAPPPQTVPRDTVRTATAAPQPRPPVAPTAASSAQTATQPRLTPTQPSTAAQDTPRQQLPQQQQQQQRPPTQQPPARQDTAPRILGRPVTGAPDTPPDTTQSD